MSSNNQDYNKLVDDNNNNNNFRHFLLVQQLSTITTNFKMTIKYFVISFIIVLTFSVGITTEFVNIMATSNNKNNVKDIYADNILTVSLVPSMGTINRHLINNSNNSNASSNNVQDETKNVVTRITGEDAKKVLAVLEEGSCLTFRLSSSLSSSGVEENGDPTIVVEIIKVDKNVNLNNT